MKFLVTPTPAGFAVFNRLNLDHVFTGTFADCLAHADKLNGKAS